ncbi:apolipoprotein N-acyltransferase [Corynebacterium falsenii]|uniref:apolipoprotein N-acyltransferase n=1 Tax=Corynebacterium falsenii TaxID=108486 RepID=UPI001CC91E66|nr:apolipoprotein N-acyltransferase [Corynebacterium falsenii]UBI06197.1 apolipoprotein N-acyltransferase [Corynebacterium falsenii]
MPTTLSFGQRLRHFFTPANLLSILAAAFSGLMLFAAYQPTGLWWAAPLAFGLFFAVVRSHNAVLLAWVQGLSLYGFLLPWVGEFVGPIAWIGLAVAQSLYSILFGLGLRYLLRRRFLQVAIPFWFVAVEYLRSSWPFGGFPWGRITWSQVGGPYAELIRWGGPSLVTFAVVVTGLALAVATRRAWAASLPVLAVVAAALVVATVTAPSSASSPSSQSDATIINVAAVQGNVPRMGLDFNEQRRAVLDNHVRETDKLAQAVKAGEAPQPDLVIWPENASDINPFVNEDASQLISQVQGNINAPILVGTITPEHNTMVVWDNGPQERHNKKFLQPFGEYMPLRDLLRHVSPYVDRAGNFQPGEGNGVVTMTPHTGKSPVAVGVATCYEVSFDGAFRQAVRSGAQVLTSPTNNATFGFTDMTYQQLAMSRMRAIEYDRAVVVAATSGVSAIVMPDGQVVEQSRIFTPDVLQANVPLRDTMTLSARIGPWLEWVVSAVGLAGVIIAWFLRKRPSPQQARRTSRTK